MKTKDDRVRGLIEELRSLCYVHTKDIPDIDLYMDQVTTFMDQHLAGCRRYDEDKILTKTMINNYAKNDLLPPPVKKKYSKDHLILLSFIYYFKSFLSIGDIQVLLSELSDKYFTEDHSQLEQIYNEIVKMEKMQLTDLMKETSARVDLASQAFEDAPEEDQEYLQLFSYVCMLSFDVYVKKHMIESIIDDMRKTKEEKEAAEKEKKKNK